MNLINNKTEEILKWRQQHEMMNYIHGETSPIFLSHHHQQQQQGETPLLITGTQQNAAAANNKLNSPPKNDENKKAAKFYITLAKESPIRCYDENDSDTTYDSYHARSTDVCMDSCDTESNSSSEYSTEGIATVEVVEYEVASASASEDLYSNDSSSGTDEDLFAMAKEILKSELVVSVDKRSSGCGFWSSDFADTEESNNSDDSNCIDSELSPADYWICVKCKNRQNNPMFRYCEKCYQIRKTHFPPRPKLVKKRKNRKRNSSSQTFSHNNLDEKRRKFDSPPFVRSQNELTASPDRKICSNQQIPSCNPLDTASTSSVEIGKNNMNLTNSNIIKFNEENSKLNGNDDNNDDDSHSSNNSYPLFEKSSKLGKNIYSSNNNNNINYNSAINCSFNNNRKRKAPIMTDLEICSPKRKFVINTDNNLFENDSGIGSAPSTQEYSEIDHYNHINNDAGIEPVPKLISNVHTNNELQGNILNNLDRHLSDLSPIINKTNNDSLIPRIPRSISLTDIIGIDPQSSSNAIPLNNNSTNFDDNLSVDHQIESYGLCIICVTEPKNGAFVHSRFVHLSCCYKCAVKIWNKNKKCPICNCAVKNVMKLFVH